MTPPAWRAYLQTQWQIRRRNASPLTLVNALWIGMALYFWTRAASGWILRDAYSYAAFAGIIAGAGWLGAAIRAWHWLYREEDNAILLTAPLPLSALYRIRTLQLYLDLLPWAWFGGIALAGAASMESRLAPQLATSLASLAATGILLAPLGLLTAQLANPVIRALAAAPLAGRALLAILPFAAVYALLQARETAVMQTAGTAAAATVYALVVFSGDTLLAWGLLLLAALPLYGIGGMRLQTAYGGDYSGLQNRGGGKSPWLWAWNETAHGFLPRRIRALVFRDLAMMYRGGFSRIWWIAIATLLLPFAAWLDYARPQTESAFFQQFKFFCYALPAYAVLSYAVAFDFLKRRGDYLGIDCSQPLPPKRFFWAHYASTALWLIPVTAAFVLTAAAAQSVNPAVAAIGMAPRLALLGAVIGLNAVVSACAEFDGRLIPSESAFLMTVAALGLVMAVCLAAWPWLALLALPLHAGGVRRGLTRLARIEVTW